MPNFNDKLGISDELLTSDGRLIMPMDKRPMNLIGQITAINGLTGKKMFVFNDIIIPGATYILEKFFNTRSTFGMTTLSQDLAVKGNVVPNQSNLKDEVVFGFVLGTGGVDTPDLVKSVKFKDKSVATIVPLRVVDITADLIPTDQAKYAIKKTVGSKYYYYGKKFDTAPIIRHLFTDGTEIPPNVDQVDTSLGLLVFGESILTVSAFDLREYFMLTYGNIDNCRFNSLGLTTGFLDTDDYAGVRVATKINLPNMFLRDSESFYTFIYKVYAI
jgi:hypothetical protein